MRILDPSIWAKCHVFINQRLKVWKDREFTMKGKTNVMGHGKFYGLNIQCLIFLSFK